MEATPTASPSTDGTWRFGRPTVSPIPPDGGCATRSKEKDAAGVLHTPEPRMVTRWERTHALLRSASWVGLPVRVGSDSQFGPQPKALVRVWTQPIQE